jgi:phosphomannomutase
MAPHRFNPTILREYDIRGTVGKTLSAADAGAIGRAFGTIVQREGKGTTVCVGYDGRVSSPELEAALVDGLTSTGVDVARIGRGPTPLLYYSVFHLNSAGGIMVTGSHNPGDQNGFKLVLGRKAFHGAAIAALGRLAAEGSFAQGEGRVTSTDVRPSYTDELVAAFRPARGSRKLTVAWDPGNGGAGEIVGSLAQRLPGKHIAMNTVIDGTFPAHHPDPAEEKNLRQIKDAVLANKCDIGLAFDGDGDRLGVVDDRARMVSADQILALLAREVLAARPGSIVVADVKSSQMLFDEVARLGGKPLMWRTGHALIKDKLAETKAPLAGELSGHLFFADRYYGYDDALYAAVRVLAVLVDAGQPLSAIVDALPRWSSTPEIRVHCAEERKFVLVDELRARLKQQGAEVIDIDGARVTTKDGWWLVRASNTEAALVVRAEGRDDAALARVRASLQRELKLSGASLP